MQECDHSHESLGRRAAVNVTAALKAGRRYARLRRMLRSSSGTTEGMRRTEILVQQRERAESMSLAVACLWPTLNSWTTPGLRRFPWGKGGCPQT